MEQYKQLCRDILEKGQYKPDRTNTGTISYFGYQSRYDLNQGFPLLTTKKVFFKGILAELLWFISGETNIRPLVLQNVKIWNEWPYEKFKQSQDYHNETLEEFVEKIKNDEEFAKKHGDLGPVYGKQWRDFFGVDQLKELEKQLKENKFSRRHIICAWNPAQIKDMALPPCHAFMQFYVSADNRLSCQLYQRSADVFLGVPFNIASYFNKILVLPHNGGTKSDFIKNNGVDILDGDILVGDTEDDIEAALQLGITPFLVTSGIRSNWIVNKLFNGKHVNVIENIKDLL